MNYAFIILGVVFIFVLYYYLYSDGSTVLTNKLDLSILQTPVPVASIGGSPDSRRYSIEMWMYVYNFDGAPKYIISRMGVDDDHLSQLLPKAKTKSPSFIPSFLPTSIIKRSYILWFILDKTEAKIITDFSFFLPKISFK